MVALALPAPPTSSSSSAPRAGRLPAIVHGGADRGALELSDTVALIAGGIEPSASNVVDDPVRLALLPEHWTGWVGRPGLSGSRGGRDWSPKFTSTAVRVDGDAVVSGSGDPTLAQAGMASVEVDAVDDVA